MEIKPIGKIINDYDTKFGIPRQSCLENALKSTIIFYDDYNDISAFKELDNFNYIWLIWGFSENINKEKSLTVRPPRLGGNKRVGVFASRSPFRPNNLGLSSVKLERIIINNNKVSLEVSGADLMNGTPIYDIKPYIKISDCHQDAISGFSDKMKDYKLDVIVSDNLLKVIDKDKQQGLIEILSQDPRPSYHEDGRIYGFKFSVKEIKFKVENNTLTVLGIENEWTRAI